jgi:UDP-glucuronate 4-epimerase
MHVLVTGAAGFIGSHVCERLLQDGHSVVGLDHFNAFYDPAQKERNVAEIAAVGGERFRLARTDLRDLALLREAMVGVDAVVHLAAMAGVQPSIREPLVYQDINVRGTLHVLEAMREEGVKRLVFASSSSVYGNAHHVPFAESENVDKPISPYAATKKAGELLCHTWHHLHDFSVICLRFFTVYGPRQRPDLAIAKFIRMIDNGEPIALFGDGSSSRDYTFVLDTVDGIARALAHTAQPGYAIYNIGNSGPIALIELVARIEAAVGTRAIVHWQPMQAGDVERTWADLTRAREVLGYEPQTSIEEGLAAQVAWWRAQPKLP